MAQVIKSAILLSAFAFFVVLGVSESFGQHDDSEGRARAIVLKKDAAKNGYTLTRDDGKTYLQGVGVENPQTKRPLEGPAPISYGCETPEAIESVETGWIIGRSSRIEIRCSMIYKPTVTVADTSGEN